MTPEEFDASMKEKYGEGYEEAYSAETEEDAYRTYLRSRSDASFAKYVVSAEEVSKSSDSDIYVYYFTVILIFMYIILIRICLLIRMWTEMKIFMVLSILLSSGIHLIL